MSTVDRAGPRPSRGPLTDLLTGGGRGPAGRSGWLVGAAGAVLRWSGSISGEEALTSSSTMAAALLLAVPIGLAALGGLFSERAGVVNIGLEGMMILGTWGAGWAGYQWGWAAALVGGVLFGALGGLLHAVATVTFGVDHVVSGVAINILAAGHRPLPLRAALHRQPGRRRRHPVAGAVEQPARTSPCRCSRPGPDLLGDLEQPALVPDQRPGRRAARAHQRRRRADHPRRAADPGVLPAALADGVRAAAALLRREPGGGRLPRRRRSTG